MKKYLKISIVLLLVAALIQNCTKEKTLNLNLTPISAINAPPDNVFVLLQPTNLDNTISFQWDQSRAEDGSLVLYDVVFDQVGGDFSKPFYITTSDGKGVQNTLTSKYSDLNSIAEAGGADFLQRKKFIWTARASKGSNILKASQSRTIDIQRPNGFKVIPTKLFLTGTATEGGTNISNAIEMIPLSPGEFEIYTQLQPGSYQMIDATTGTPNTFSVSMIGGVNVLTNGGQSAFSGTKGQYRFKVNFKTFGASNPLQIKGIGYWLCAPGDTLATLKYQGKGVWQATEAPLTLASFTWGTDDRYKYRLYLGDGTTEFWGYTGSDSPGQDGNYPNKFSAGYNNAAKQPDTDQFNYSWKFDKPAVNGKNVTLIMKFQPPAYSNQYIVQ